MPTTPNYALRYPALADAPNVPLDLQELATDVDTAVNTIDNRVDAIEATLPSKLSTTASVNGKRIHRQDYIGGTTDATGFLTFTHSAGFTPTFVQVFSRTPSGSFAFCWGTDTYTATTVRARFMHASTGGTYNSGATGAFTAIFWE